MLLTSQSQWHFFYGNRKGNPKIHIESQKTKNSQSNLEKTKQNKVLSIMLPDFKICYKVTFKKYGTCIKKDKKTNGKKNRA